MYVCMSVGGFTVYYLLFDRKVEREFNSIEKCVNIHAVGTKLTLKKKL